MQPPGDPGWSGASPSSRTRWRSSSAPRWASRPRRPPSGSHRRLGAVDVRGRAAGRLRGDAGPGRACWSTASARAGDGGRRAGDGGWARTRSPGHRRAGGAVLARILVGAGDAMTFISVLRLIPAWFPARRVPLITQLTGQLGQLGQVASTIPLVAALAGPGLDAGLPGRRRGRRAGGGRWSWSWSATPGRRPAVAPVPVSWRQARPRSARVVPAPGHPARAVVALQHPVLRDGLRPALGLSRS